MSETRLPTECKHCFAIKIALSCSTYGDFKIQENP